MPLEHFYSFIVRRRPEVKTVEHDEGGTRLLVPAASLARDPPPTAPVFFNPAASLNRDVSVALADATGASTFCDSMAGVGARGLRIANEVSAMGRVALVDFNSKSLELAKEAAALNGVERKCEFSVSETSSYLLGLARGERFDTVDVDPFGSPVAQVQAALSATSDGGVTSVTATDTAVLCGVYPRVSERRYWSVPLSNRFHHETGVRILAGTVARLGGAVDIGTEPVAAHTSRHYVRLYVRVHPGAARADRALRNLREISWCPSCGEVSLSGADATTCGVCGKKAKVAGPLWGGPLTDQRIVEAAGKRARARGFAAAAAVLRSLEGLDSFPPWSFSIEAACSELGIASVPEDRVYAGLKRLGRRAMRTPFEKTGVKTDATHAEFLSAVREAAPGHAVPLGAKARN